MGRQSGIEAFDRKDVASPLPSLWSRMPIVPEGSGSPPVLVSVSRLFQETSFVPMVPADSVLRLERRHG